ncbi:MAG: hypothetical protein GKR88_02130 [Flavobacteriaceae bacterium]|nr:MAG: hypothetical protein GKR88_02130 [Flavobacteriaceae bacterium]
MTTITIKNNEKLTQTEFEAIDDMLEYFLHNRPGIILPLNNYELNSNQKKQWEKVNTMDEKDFVDLR